jgi:hypothetical protein
MQPDYSHLVWREEEAVALLPFLPCHLAWVRVSADEAGRPVRLPGVRYAQRSIAAEALRLP